jgi:hypothetical protein
MTASDNSSSEQISPGAQASASAVVDTIKHEGRRLVDEAKDSATSVAREQTGAAASFLEDVASAIHEGADALKTKGRSDAASFAEWTADEIGSLAGGLSRRSPADMLSEVEDLARRQPALVAGAAFLVAFGLMRFMKSSSGRVHSAQAGR